jgi:hypothetical protein
MPISIIDFIMFAEFVGSVVTLLLFDSLATYY